VGQLDPDRQVEFDELMAALTGAEALSPGDPVLLYVHEIAFLEPPPLAKEADLIAAIRRGDEAARNQLTELNLWEVVGMARQFIGRGVPFLDLVQQGNLGLIRAVVEAPLSQGPFGEQRDARVREAINRAFR
jgi:RNA polymerase primary sigma factor